MTSTFSGGIVYEFFEGVNRYGLIKVHDDGSWERLKDFENLKESLEACTDNSKTLLDWTNEQLTIQRRPAVPERSTYWLADAVLPGSPIDWDEVALQVNDEEWVCIEREMHDLLLDEMSSTF